MRSAFRGKLFFLSTAILACAVTGDLAAQTVTGSIGGIVTDANGSAIPAAKVTAISSALITETKTIETDGSGYYKFLELPPGTYNVKFEMSGFKGVLKANIVLTSATQITTDARLEVGDVSQEVTVQESGASIDLEHVTSFTAATQAVMEGIPTGRSPWAIGNTVAAVTPTTYDVGGSAGMQQSALTAHGSTSADQKFMIDGVSVNWPGGGGGSTLMYYDMGMFQEVNYLIGAVPADVSQGGVYMNMVTKDGGNQIHGAIFLNGASQGMQSNNVGTALQTQLFNNLSSAIRSKVDLTKVIPGNPTTETYDYNGQVGGPIIRDKLWWFTSWRLWATNNIVAGAFNLDGSQAVNDNKIADEMAKFSYQPNTNNRFSLMYFRNQKNRYHRRNQGSFGDNVTTVLQNQPGYDAHFKWTYTPSAKWVIDAGFALNSGKTPYRYQAGITDQISVYDSGTATVYNAAQYNYINPCYRAALDVAASYTASALGGQHSFRVGLQESHDGYNQRYTANGDIQGVLINGVPSTATLYNTPLNQQKNNLDITGLYVEDTYTIFRRLTFNLGLRWERMYGSIPAQTSPVGNFVAARSYAAINGVPNFHNWTPRFGVSWDVTGRGKTVIKASANRYMQGLGMNVVTAVNPLGYSTASVPWSDRNGDLIPQISELNLTAFNGFVGGVSTHLDPSLRRPYSWEESLGVQQQLPLNVIVSITGWYRSTFDQVGRVNLSVPTSAYTPVVIKSPLSASPITVYNQSAATKGLVNYALINSRALNTQYRGIDITFRRQMTRRWMVLGGFTASRARGASFGDINSSLDDLNNPNYSNNRLGALSNDAPYNFKIGGTYKLPWKFVMSGNLQHVSGYPILQQYTVNSSILGSTLIQSSQLIYLAPNGDKRLPAVNLVDLRFSRDFRIGERWKIQPQFDIYNLNNSAAVTSVNQSASSLALFLNPTAVLPPRIFKVGLRADF